MNNVWNKKEERSAQAETHTKNMNKWFSKEIRDCVVQSTLYGYPDRQPAPIRQKGSPKISFLNTDTVSTFYLQEDGKNITILNFASYKNPGGKFLEGSSAQEEMLCHTSFLYNVLLGHRDYYEWNNQHKNKALYTNRAIFSPNVLFFQTKPIRNANVITCASPNKGVALRYGQATETENKEALKERIRFIHRIAAEQNTEILILGAFGCGVFRQNPTETAELFQEEFKESPIPEIIFAVPGNNRNSTAFQNMVNTIS